MMENLNVDIKLFKHTVNFLLYLNCRMFDWIKTKTSRNRKDFGSFNFYIKSEPQHIDSSSTLSLTSYSNALQSATIPCVYRWSVIKNGCIIQRPQFKGSSYKCEPSDVGSLIQAEVISTDPEFSGTAILRFGPVRLDLSLKKQIQMALLSGGITMPVHVVRNIEQRQCQVRLSEDKIKLNHVYSEGQFQFDYTIYEPRMETMSKDSCKLTASFSEKYSQALKNFTKKIFDDPFKDSSSFLRSTNNSTLSENQSNILQIKFANHNSRDVFLFVVKAFNAKKQLRSAMIMNKLENVDFKNQQNFDCFMEIQGLKNQLIKMDQSLKKTIQEKNKFASEIHRLQKEIQATILTYTKIVQEKFHNTHQLSRSYSILSQKRDEIISKKYKNLQNENNHLNSRIQALTKQIDIIRFQPQASSRIRTSPVLNVHFDTNSNKLVTQNNVISPFTKKNSHDDTKSFVNFLDDLGASRISYISQVNSIKQSPQNRVRIEGLQKQKEQLQKKLEMSFSKIQKLQELLQTKQQTPVKSNPQKLNQSSINFNYNSSLNQSTSGIQSLNQSKAYDNEKNLQAENVQLRKNNEFLLSQNMKLLQQINRVTNLSHNAKSLSRSNSLYQHNDSVFIQQTSLQSQDVKKVLFQKDNEINILRKQVDCLKGQNMSLKSQSPSSQKISFSSCSSCLKLSKKMEELANQLEIYKRNSDVLNRSQQLSMEMSSFNEQQLQMIKKHNEFLTMENQKLVKACEKYMNQAKESNKLRLQILKLKERANLNQKIF